MVTENALAYYSKGQMTLKILLALNTNIVLFAIFLKMILNAWELSDKNVPRKGENEKKRFFFVIPEISFHKKRHYSDNECEFPNRFYIPEIFHIV